MKDKEVDGVLNGDISDPERKCLAIWNHPINGCRNCFSLPAIICNFCTGHWPVVRIKLRSANYYVHGTEQTSKVWFLPCRDFVSRQIGQHYSHFRSIGNVKDWTNVVRRILSRANNTIFPSDFDNFSAIMALMNEEKN